MQACILHIEVGVSLFERSNELMRTIKFIWGLISYVLENLQAQILCLSTMASQPLRVAIFPYIPDLAGDKLAGLKRFIADEFKKVSGESIEVETDADLYDLYKLKSTYLTDDRDAYDVMEVDTIILEELVKTGRLQALEDHFTVTEDVFTPCAVHSVRYSPNLKSHLYGVPTLICASFLMELADVDHTSQKTLLKD